MNLNIQNGVLFLIGCFIIVSCNKTKRDLYPEKLVGGFELLSPAVTGVDFNNSIQESTYFNHYYFSQIYLGSGVAIGDINNDGLSDIYFGGNQVSDRLFLNKGNFQFEDITKSSKAAVNSGWTWGVTMADVNADGYLDIYLSRNGNSLQVEDRRNQLYINNQDNTFTESAIAYGLADIGFSTQAAFFDMDNDGDLDMYQVNQPPDKKLMLINKIERSDYKNFRDRLYRNDNGRFVDVSESSGISRKIAFGLSVNVSDFNNDGHLDLYVANDYSEPDFMYYNNGNGTFRNVINENLRHITNLSMGSDAADVNNDGFIDLITTDMTPADHYRAKTNMASMSTENFRMLVDAGAHYQYMANALQINSGVGVFSDVSYMTGTAFTDWSWSSLLVDLDNDGLKDLIVSNGIKKDVDNNDYRLILNNLDKNTTVDELFQLSKNTPSQPIPNYAFKNLGNLEFKKVAKEWSLDQPGFSNGMAYGDLDNDGDLDLVMNNIESPAFIYLNNTNGNFLKIAFEGYDKNRFGFGTRAIIYHNGKKQIGENLVTRGYFSSVEPGLLFGLGKDILVDSVQVVWPDGKVNRLYNIRANREIKVDHTDAKIKPKDNSSEVSKVLLTQLNPSDIGLSYVHKENAFDEYVEEILLPHNVSQNGPFMDVGDVNSDGLEDLFIGGAVGQSGVLFIQNSNGGFTESNSQPWQQDSACEDLEALFFDADNDGDLDLYVTSGGSEHERGSRLLKDRLYLNDGQGTFVKSINSLPNIFESTQCVKASDIDLDGDLDLFIGTRLIAGKYGFPPGSYLLLNDKGKFTRASSEIAPSLENIGMVTDAVFTDIDLDSDKDLIIVGEWMGITVLENVDGVFRNVSEKLGLEDTRGIWWSITASDLDNDGDEDYIIGNLGLNNKFKASKEHPFKLYVNDFDENGTNDVVLAKFYKDDYVPVRGRECTSQQMPYVAEKFKDYHTFASSKLAEILPENKMEDAIVYEIKNFESIVLINDDGVFTRKPLPRQAQVSPIKSSVVRDVNADGNMDIIAVGNHYGVEVETVRYDAGLGMVLLGDGKNNFDYLPPTTSGFYCPYDSRSLNVIGTGDEKDLIVVTNNNNNLSIFR